MSDDQHQYGLFLSYNSQDHQAVLDIRQRLQQLPQALNTFIDRECTGTMPSLRLHLNEVCEK